MKLSIFINTKMSRKGLSFRGSEGEKNGEG